LTPLIYTTLSFILGIILGSAFLYLPLSTITLSITSIIVISILNKGRIIKFIALSIIALLGGLYYIFSTISLPKEDISNFVQEEVTLRGRIMRPPQRGIERTTFYLDVDEIYSGQWQRPASGKVRISGDITLPLQYGDIILVRTKLKRPRSYHNPGGYDFENALARDRVYVVGWVKEEDIIRLGFRGNHLLRLLYDAREDIRKAIEQSLKGESSSILQSMIIGEEKGLNDEIRDAFMASGTTHILSISGSHLGLLAFIIYNILRLSILTLPSRFLLKLTLYTTPSKISALLTMPPVIIYTIIAGGQVATIRSLIMILVYLFAILIEREDRLINSLAFAALIILLLNPQVIYDISFQLSYGSILSIGYILEWWKRRERDPLYVEEKGLLMKMKKRLIQYLLVTLSATLGTAPLVAYHFNQFSWVGLFSNIIIIPLAGAVIVPLGLLSGFITALSGSSALPMAPLLDRIVSIFYLLVRAFSKIPHAALHLPSPSIPLISLYYLFLYTLLESKGNRWARFVSITAFSLIMIFTISLFLKNPKGIRVTFIDVGQGDSSLIELPDRKRILIDGGGGFDKGFDIGRRVIAPYLWDRGIRGIDYLVLSHPHPDHIGGLIYIIKGFRIGEVWVNGDYAIKGYTEFLRLIEEKGIQLITVKRGDALLKDSYNIYILHPYPQFDPSSPRGEFSAQNNRSIVLKLVYKNHSFLFSGDIEKEAEENLIYLDRWLRADVIKVPHHGGKTSSIEEFISLVRPEIAVVSSGRDNIFHHPNPDTIMRYERLGIKVYRTDLDGAVILESDGEKMKVETFRDRSLERIVRGGNLSIRISWEMEKRNIRKILGYLPYFLILQI